MNVVRWDPFRDLMTIQDRVQRLLSDQAVRDNGEEGYGAWVPPVDIFQDKDNLVLRAEVPGVDKDNIDVRVENAREHVHVAARRERHQDADRAGGVVLSVGESGHGKREHCEHGK